MLVLERVCESVCGRLNLATLILVGRTLPRSAGTSTRGPPRTSFTLSPPAACPSRFQCLVTSRRETKVQIRFGAWPIESDVCSLPNGQVTFWSLFSGEDFIVVRLRPRRAIRPPE